MGCDINPFVFLVVRKKGSRNEYYAVGWMEMEGWEISSEVTEWVDGLQFQGLLLCLQSQFIFLLHILLILCSHTD